MDDTMTAMTNPLQGAPYPTAAPARAVPDGTWAGFWRRWGFVLAGFPLAVAAFVVVLTLVVVGVSLVWLVVTLPLLAFALYVATGFATIDRRRVGWLEGAVPPTFHRGRRPGGFLRRALGVVADPQRWRDVLHAIVAFPVRITTFVLAVTFPAVALGGLTYWLWEWALPDDPDNTTTLLELMGLPESRVADITFYFAAGVLFLIITPYLVRGCAAVDAGLVKILCSDDHADLRARVDALAVTRAAAADAEVRTLRKVERDIHDGPQQRLVRVTMDLQAAQRRRTDDPAAADALVDEALEHVRGALDELRAVSRGIAPPILVDRGLGAALSAAAARSPVPVDLTVELGEERLPPAVENAVYYVVVESLTNVAKHARATRCTVEVREQTVSGSSRLRVLVADDGVGGAHVGKGHGLAGLSDRVAALDGTLTVSSPEGGPTVLQAELPVRTHG